MTHNKNCIERFNRYEDLKREFEAKYPNHCKKCGGWGGFHYHGSYWEPPDFDLCACIEDGFCPRCGEKTMTDDSIETCSLCGWNIEDPDGLPEQPECFCDFEVEQV